MSEKRRDNKGRILMMERDREKMGVTHIDIPIVTRKGIKFRVGD